MPNSLGRVRALNHLKSLKSLGYNITLAVLVDNQTELKNKEVIELVDNIIYVKLNKITRLFYLLLGLFSRVPLRTFYVKSNKFKKLLIEETRKHNYQIIYFKRLRMAQYINCVSNVNSKIVIDITDSLTKYYFNLWNEKKGISNIFYYLEYVKHKLYEPKVCKKHEFVVICSHSDKVFLEEIEPNIEGKLIVLRNSIDISEWGNLNIRIRSRGERNNIVFWGVMNYPPNILAVEYFIKSVFNLIPDNKLTIIGPNGDFAKYIESIPNIEYLGYVEDLPTVASTYDVFICPILAGSGVKNKVIQSAALGLPIISTSVGVDGVDKELSKYFFIADNPMDFVKSLDLINNLSDEELIELLLNQREAAFTLYENVINFQEFLKNVI